MTPFMWNMLSRLAGFAIPAAALYIAWTLIGAYVFPASSSSFHVLTEALK